MLVGGRCLSRQARGMDDEMEIVVRVAQERVGLTGRQDQRVALPDGDRLLPDADFRAASRNEIYLRQLRMEVRLIDAFVGVSDGHAQLTVPGSGEPTLRVARLALESHPLVGS